MFRGRFSRKTKPFEPDLYASQAIKRVGHYEAFIPHPIINFDEPISQEMISLLSETERALQRLDLNPDLAPLQHILLRSESIASSKIEGLHIKPSQLIRSQANRLSGVESSHLASEVLGNIEAMREAIKLASESKNFTLENLLSIHRTLMLSSDYPQIAGVIRTEQNWIGGNDFNPIGAAYIPPPPENLEHLLEDLIESINSRNLSPLIHAAVVHAQFEAIHPFADGNGRTGRALIHVVMRRHGLTSNFVSPISVIFANHKDAYIEGLNSFRKIDEASKWFETFNFAMRTSVDVAEKYLGRTYDLYKSWKEKITAEFNPRPHSAVWLILDQFFATPIFNVQIIADACGITFNAAARAIDQCQQVGIITPYKPHNRNRAWEASGILELLNNLNKE